MVPQLTANVVEREDARNEVMALSCGLALHLGFGEAESAFAPRQLRKPCFSGAVWRSVYCGSVVVIGPMQAAFLIYRAFGSQS